MSSLTTVLATGRDYLWAIRQGFGDPAEGRAALADAGLDPQTLMALRALDGALARFAHPSARATDGEYVRIVVPGEIPVYFSPLVCERGLDAGTELFPQETVWTFGHRETQVCLGGDTAVDAVLAHGATQSLRVRPGDVVAVPAGTTLHTHSSEDGGFGHAHLFLSNLGEGEPQTFYDAVGLLRLQQREVLELGMPAPPLERIDDRLEVSDWSALAEPTGRTPDRPTWLRHGWEQRELARALDYAEGTKAVVVASPDRDVDAFLDWGDGPFACRINPLIAEHTCAVTDCLLPDGFARSHPYKELWTTLRGEAQVTMTLAPLHDTEVTVELAPGVVAAIPGAARVGVRAGADGVLVRRMAESCAHNAHWAMMEHKLVAAGALDAAPVPA